ncbi:MAG TPA: hypothetical protein VFR78_22080 [Pyrinomonadaceae bacterium]|nr:hypothetical protein [Pyrinomonadaceae bacterium]
MNLQPIFWGGLIAGTLDLVAACVSAWLRSSVTPIQVAQFIASGVLGRASFTGGARTAALGVALHFLIATVAAAVFYFASRKFLGLVERPVTYGLLYGVVVHLFMTQVIVPLSSVRQQPVTFSGFMIGVLIIMFCVGLPIALIVRRFSR